MNLKRYEQKVGYAQLDNLIETLGEKGLMSVIVERLSQGIKPSLIASNLQVPFMVLWEWLEADPARQRAYDQGWQLFAQDIHAETVRIADECTIEEVPLAKLRIDTRFKAASSYDKKRFGAKDIYDVGRQSGNVTINISSVEIPEIGVSGNTLSISAGKVVAQEAVPISGTCEKVVEEVEEL